MRQDRYSWDVGYRDGLEGKLKLFPNGQTINATGLDPLSYASGRVEGETERIRRARVAHDNT